MAVRDSFVSPPNGADGQSGTAAVAPAPGKRHSFDSVCGKCGALLPAGRNACLVCRADRDTFPYQGEFPVPSGPRVPVRAGDGDAGAVLKTPDIWMRWVTGLAGLIFFVLAALAGYSVYLLYFDVSSYRARDAILFEDAAGRLVMSYPGLEYPKAITGMPLTANDQAELRASPDGRWIACTAKNGELYLLDLAQRGASDRDAIEAAGIAADLAQPAVFSENSEFLIYLTKSGELFASDMTESWQLDTSVTDMVAVDGRRVLYTRRGDEKGKLDLYLDYLPKDGGEWHVIDRGVGEVLDWTSGFEKLLYTGVKQNENGNETNCLLLFELNKNTTSTLASDVGGVLDASAEKGTAVYLSAYRHPLQYEDFVDDDYAAYDASLREPVLEKYPLVAEAFSLYGDDGGESIGDLENEELLEEYTRYREAQRQWEDKQTRNRLRQTFRRALAPSAPALELFDLYVNRNGVSVLLGNGVVDNGSFTVEAGHVSAAKNYIVYQTVDPDTLRKIKISSLWERPGDWSLDPQEYFFRNVRRDLLFSQLDGTPARLYTRSDNTTFKQWRVAPGADGVYFTVGMVSQRTGVTDALYYAPLKNGIPSEASLVERNIVSIEWPFRDGILFKTGNQDISRTCLVQSSQARVIGDPQTIVYQPVNNAGTLFYLADIDKQTQTGTLFMFTREDRMLASGVIGYEYHGDDLVYIFKPGDGPDDYEIHFWQSGRLTFLEKDVRGILGIPAQNYSNT